MNNCAARGAVVILCHPLASGLFRHSLKRCRPWRWPLWRTTSSSAPNAYLKRSVTPTRVSSERQSYSISGTAAREGWGVPSGAEVAERA